MKNKIENCPCCNGTAIIEAGYTNITKMIVCEECGIRTYPCFTEEEAIKKWNKREWYKDCK